MAATTIVDILQDAPSSNSPDGILPTIVGKPAGRERADRIEWLQYAAMILDPSRSLVAFSIDRAAPAMEEA